MKHRNVIGSQVAKFLFQARTKMLKFKANFGKKYENEDTNCPLKCDIKDTQEHILECDKICDSTLSKTIQPRYFDLLSRDVNKQIEVALILQDRFKMRKLLPEAE